MRVYSPSQTEAWSMCPVYWWWGYKRGWKPRVIGRREVAGVQGVAFAAGMQVYNEGKMARSAVSEEAIVHAVTAQIERTVQGLQDAGFDLTILGEYGDLAQVVSAAAVRASHDDPTPPDWEVVAVERPRPEHGHARCDVVYQRPDGGRVVRDYKFTQAVEKKYVPMRLRDYGEATQRHHYQWMEQADTFIVTLVVATPFHIWEQPFIREERRAASWLASQREKWALMERMSTQDLPLFESDSHITKYGRGESAKCVFYEWCLEHGRDPQALEALGFIRETRKGAS